MFLENGLSSPPISFTYLLRENVSCKNFSSSISQVGRWFPIAGDHHLLPLAFLTELLDLSSRKIPGQRTGGQGALTGHRKIGRKVYEANGILLGLTPYILCDLHHLVKNGHCVLKNCE